MFGVLFCFVFQTLLSENIGERGLIFQFPRNAHGLIQEIKGNSSQIVISIIHVILGSDTVRCDMSLSSVYRDFSSYCFGVS